MTTRKKAKPRTMATGVRDLARIVNELGEKISPRAITDWRRHPDWPFGKPPWNVGDVLAWRVRTLSPDPAKEGRARDGTMSPYTRSKIAVNLHRAKLLEQKFGILAGKYILKDEATATTVELLQLVKAGMLAAPRHLAARLANKPEIEIEDVLLTTITKIFNEYAGPQDASNSASAWHAAPTVRATK